MASAPFISYCQYGFETSFSSVSTAIDKTFGHDVKITTLARRNNIARVLGIGSRNTEKMVPLKYEGAVSVEFALANPWFLRGVMGSYSSVTGTPDTHTFTESNTVESITIFNQVSSDTESVAKLLGGTMNTMELTAAVGELVRVRLDIPFATETEDDTTAARVAETFAPMIFAQANLELPNATTISDIQSASITINNNAEYLWGIGSRFATQAPVKNREYSSRVTRPMEDAATFLERLYGSATAPVAAPDETATMELIMDNGLTGDLQRQVAFLFTGVIPDEHNLPQDPVTLVIEDVPLIMRSVAITAKNATTAAL